VDELRTLVEEVEEGLAEVRRWAMEFKRDVIIGGENQRTGKTSAEKVLRWGCRWGGLVWTITGKDSAQVTIAQEEGAEGG
jgi:hypothetical protein